MTTLTNKLCKLLYAVFVCMFFLSCQKDIDYVSINGQGPDLITKVNSSVSGFVTDENNIAVKDASVIVGGINTTTDKYGYFEIKNVQVVQNAAVVTVSKNGYFKGIKTYGATNNKAAFFRIKLIPKINAGTISASSGGNITLSNGLIVSLPANGVVTASNSSAYTGTINVAAHWIDPTGADLNKTMPGDLRGIDETGSLKGLTTYGMVAVELTGASGELLQIASGKKATLTIPLPTAVLASAPSSIPLWYFDESLGLWKQDGSAVKTGNTYVGDVSHFSFWNFDIPNAYVPLSFNIVDAAGNPISNAYVEIGTVPVTWSHASGYADASGYVSLYVAPNTQYSLTVYSYCSFYLPAYTQNFNVSTNALYLGNITLSAANTASLTGIVTDCTNNPVSNGFVIIQNGNDNFRQSLGSNGSFNYNTIICTTGSNITVIGGDFTNFQQSLPMNLTLTPGANNLPNLQACGVTIQQEYFNYNVDGNNYSITYPSGSFIEWAWGPTGTQVLGGNNASNAVTTFDSQNIGLNSIQDLGGFKCSQVQDSMIVTTPVHVNITEYGNIGEYISGNFSGTLTGIHIPVATYNISCNFRVKRSF